jgi:ribosomal protein L21E
MVVSWADMPNTTRRRTRFKEGDRVVLTREGRPRGTWTRFEGQKGVVVSKRAVDGEWQVRLDTGGTFCFLITDMVLEGH